MAAHLAVTLAPHHQIVGDELHSYAAPHPRNRHRPTFARRCPSRHRRRRCPRLTRAAGSGVQSFRQRRHPQPIARIVFDIDICKGLPETVPATGSRRKSRDHLRPRSGRTPQSCGIGSSSTRLRLGFLLRTRGHHHKLRRTRFQTTLPLQERRYQMSVSQRFSSRRFPSANDSSPAIWWCTRARSRASATASWATRRRTSASACRPGLQAAL
jgi:hypothetical protein